ncbi:LysR substrate-binding domain-containing protein [Streptomyces sp. SBR177]
MGRLPWITARDGTTGHAMAVRACQAAGFQPRIRHRVNDFRTVLGLAAIGQGAGFVPEMAARRAPEGVVLTRLPLFRRSRVAFRAGGGAHPAVAAFVAAARTAVDASGDSPDDARRTGSAPVGDGGGSRPEPPTRRGPGTRESRGRGKR